VRSIKNVIRREVLARQQTIVGTVIRQRQISSFDSSIDGAPVWNCDVEIGSNRILMSVPIKLSGTGRAFYADRGQTVLLRRNAQGRFEIIGPGDRITSPLVIKTYNVSDGSEVTSTSRGTTFEVVPLEFYQGTSMKGNPDVTFDQVPAANDTITRSAGSFIDDGFIVGQTIVIGKQSQENAGILGATIAAVTTSQLEFAGDPLVDEGPIECTIGVSGTSLWNDGSTPFPLVRLVDADGNPV